MNRRVIQHIVAGVTRSLAAFRGRPRCGLRVLMYHSIVHSGSGTRRAGVVSAGAFREQLQWLCGSGLRVVSLADGIALLDAGALDRTTAVVVTFDDGFLDVLRVAAPIMIDLQIPFTVFVVGSFLRQPPHRERYLSHTDLAELAELPLADVGSHGYTHRPLTRLEEGEVRLELEQSAGTLADVVGRRPTSMSYPHGAVSDRVAALVSAAGFTIAGSSLLGVNRRATSRLRLRRTEIVAGDGLSAFIAKVYGDFDWYQAKQRLYWPTPVA